MPSSDPLTLRAAGLRQVAWARRGAVFATLALTGGLTVLVDALVPGRTLARRKSNLQASAARLQTARPPLLPRAAGAAQLGLRPPAVKPRSPHGALAPPQPPAGSNGAGAPAASGAGPGSTGPAANSGAAAPNPGQAAGNSGPAPSGASAAGNSGAAGAPAAAGNTGPGGPPVVSGGS